MNRHLRAIMGGDSAKFRDNNTIVLRATEGLIVVSIRVHGAHSEDTEICRVELGAQAAIKLASSMLALAVGQEDPGEDEA